MNGTLDLQSPATWRRRLGLMAVPLSAGDTDRFVMLNGSRGNFCLDLTGETSPEAARNMAWSVDVGHHVLITGDGEVRVQRWDRSAFERSTYRSKEVQQNPDQFQRLLERATLDREKSIVRHATRLYGSLRTILGEGATGGRALGAFLVLIACAIDGSRTPDSVDLNRWALDDEALTSADAIPHGRWLALLDDLCMGLRQEHLSPELPWMLRHASGLIFQEAHYLAELPGTGQMVFSTVLPAPARSTRRGVTTQGVFFTPPYIARTLIEAVVASLPESDQLTLFDPACGSGEILREAVRQLEDKGYRGKLHVIGWDVSPIACSMARYVLGWEQQTSGLALTYEVLECDSVQYADAWPQNLTAVVMNPPFVSYQNLRTEHAEVLRRVLGAHTGQRPDLAALFLHLATNALAPLGVLGTVLPASLLESKTAQSLRESLVEQLAPTFLARLGDLTLFTNALIEAALLVAVKGGEPSARTMVWADSSKDAISAAMRNLRRFDGAPISRKSYSIYSEAYPLADKWSPRPYETAEAFRRLKGFPRVRDLFDIKQGVRTGDNDAFVLDEELWSEIPESEQPFFRKGLVNRSIRNGRIVSSVRVFYPYIDHEIYSEGRLEQCVPTYYGRYLLPRKDVLINRKKIDPDRWWELTWPRLRKEDIPRLVSTAFGRRGSWAWDNAGSYLVLNGFFWYPRLPRTGRRFDEIPENVALAYLAIMNSAFIDEMLGATSRQVGGGQWDLQNMFVNDLPLPNLYEPAVSVTALDELSAIGLEIHGARPVDENRWASAVRAVYDSSTEE